MPAAAAGLGGSPGAHSVCVDPAATTHSLTAATEVEAVCTPMPLKTSVKSTMASRRFMIGPPSMMMIRL